MRKWFLSAVVLVLAAAGLVAQTEETQADDPDFMYNVRDYDDPWFLEDRDGDGLFDFAVILDEDGFRDREALDYNRDGWMDDFYFYERDVMVRQIVDTNYDQRPDLWIYIYHGVYVERYERDTDYDGLVDLVRDYSSN